MNDDWFKRLMTKSDRFLLDLVEEGYDLAGKDDEFSSPIEHALAVAMCITIRMHFPEFGFLSVYRGMDHTEIKKTAARQRKDGTLHRDWAAWGCVFPEVKIGDYRVDFLIAYSHGLEGVGGTVVECDGHAFHEKTKEQVAKDKARERAIQEEGYRIFRFSGSEIWKDPFECAHQVIGFTHDIALNSEHARSVAKSGDIAGAVKLLKWVH